MAHARYFQKGGTMDADLALDAAKAMTAVLVEALADLKTDAITLSRDEAALTLGLVSGLAEVLKRQPGAWR